MYLRLLFVYSGAVFAPLVPCHDPNRDPSAEFGAESAGNKKLPPIGAFPTAGAVFFSLFSYSSSLSFRLLLYVFIFYYYIFVFVYCQQLSIDNDSIFNKNVSFYYYFFALKRKKRHI